MGASAPAPPVGAPVPPLPPVHVSRPYERPRCPVAARVEVPCQDGAAIVAWVYAPAGVRDEPGTPFGLMAGVPPVLMLHGNGEEHGIFGPTIDAVVAAGRSVVAVDSRAQGASSRGAAPLSYELMAADAREACARLGATQVHVLGFSDGAILGLLLARDWGAHVLSLTALGANLTPEGLPDEDRRFMVEAAAANRAWAEGGRAGVLLGDGTAAPSPAEAGRVAELLQLMVDQPQIDAASLAGITCPTTVMVGELDTILPEETHRIAASVPDARLVVVSGADHTLPKVAADAVTRELLGTVALNDVRHVPGSLDASCAPADVTVVPLPREERWARALDALYEHVDARPGTSGWTAGVWPPVGLARELLADGSYWGAFDAADVAGGTPGPEATLLGAFAVDHDADMGDGSLPGAGSGLGDPDWATLPEHDVASYHLLAVDPAARGRRVAVALLAAGERAARGLGARVVRINTSPVNVEACGLYERWGFTRHRPVWLPYEGLDLPGWTSLWEQEL